MINTNELLYVVNEFDVAKRPLTRRKTHLERHWHRAAHIWVVNAKGQMLVQKRSELKDSAPGVWEPCIGGHIGPGDDYFDGAVKELHEETGLKIAKNKLKLVKIYQDQEFREFRAVFLYKTNVPASKIVREVAEVDEVKWIDIKKFFKDLDTSEDKNWIRTGYEAEMLSALI